jgi:NitT/TauT family transport system substrate-binding protein
VLDAGVNADELITFKYEDQGVATLEDGGIYVLEDNLKRQCSWTRWFALYARP